MKKIAIMIFLFFISTFLYGQGVFTSAATGNWNASGSWTLSSGTDADGIPDADDDVTIGATHIITVDASTTVECNNLTVAGGSATSVTMAGAGSVLNIYSSLSATAAPTAGNYIDCTSDATAKVVFKRSTDGAIISGTWGTYGEKVRAEINLGSGITGTVAASVKFRELIVTSGTFSITGDLRPDEGSANTGKVTIEDGAILAVTARMSRTGTANTAFASLTINGAGQLKLSGNNTSPFPTSGVTCTFSTTSTVEFNGTGSQTVPDYSYGNVKLSTSGTKTWSPAIASRTISGNIELNGTVTWSWGGGNVISLSGNLTVGSGCTISAGSSANRIVASGSSRSLTNNGTVRVASNTSQTAGATSPFSYQYNNFSSYSFGASSTVEFRQVSSSSYTQNIDGITGSPYQNVKIEHTSTGPTNDRTWTFNSDVEILGNLDFAHNGTTGAYSVDFSNRTIKIGGNISASGSGTGTRSYTEGTSTLELKGSSLQTALGGSNLPSTFNNVTINNAAGVSLNGNTTINGTLTLTDGLLSLNDHILTLGPSATISGTPSATNMIVADYANCELRKEFSANPGSSFTFPIGDNTVTAEYSPFTLTALTADAYASAYVGVRVVNDKHINNTSASDWITRYWVVTSSGITNPTYSAQFNYVDADIVGTEANLHGGKSNGVNWTDLGLVTTASNLFTATSQTTFSDFTAGDVPPMPVELTSFNSLVHGKDIQLSWHTATEVNNYGFSVERRTKATGGGEEWSELGFINAAGNSNSPKQYSFTDENVAEGKYIYRLKMIDNDGTYEYSNEVEAEVAAPNKFELAQNYPNPFNPSTKIQYSIPVDSKVLLEIYSISGEKVVELVNEFQPTGSYTVEFNAGKLASGTYLYRIVAGNFVQVKKLMLMK